MKKEKGFLKCALAGVLAAAMIVCAMPQTALTQAQAAVIDKLPGTQSTEKSYDASFLSVTGFAKGHVNDRTEYIGTDAYRVANNEEEFLTALDDARKGTVKVIELAADLDLGWKILSEEAQSCSCISEYEQDIHGTAIYNPSILRSGVSKLNITDTNGLTIFSKGGNTIKHAEVTLQNSSTDIVIRNLTFDEMWHWSEGASSKEAGWTLMKIYAKGVWVDHCSFTLGADGNVDSENGASNVTMSWCTYSLPSDENPGTDSMLYKTVTYLEYLYQEGLLDASGRYAKLRSGGATPEQIMAYEAYHNKCNLNGSGDKDFTDGYDKDGNSLGDGNQNLHLTMAYNKVTNIGQRFPLLRQGTMHLLNCYIDNSGHMALQAQEPFKSYGGWSSNRAINARDGASVGADNCVFNGLHAINGTEKHYVGYANMNEGWDVAFSEAYNHPLVVNSKVTYGGETYIGSSWDNNGNNLFIESPSGFWSDGGSTIGHFYWYSSIDNVENYTRGIPPTDENGEYIPFQFSYSEEGLPYSYNLIPLDEVEATVDAYAGSHVYNQDASFWLRTDYAADEQIAAMDKSVNVPAEDIHISEDAITIDAGNVTQLNADVVPSYATEQEVTWTSSDPSVAEVKDSGLVIAKSGGSAVITAAAKDGSGIAKTCGVTVTVGVSDITINAPSKNVYLGDETTPADVIRLTAVVEPEDATNHDVEWSSSNENILKVDENGVLTPVKKGTAYITCTSVSNPDIFTSVRFTVKEGANPNPLPSEDPGTSEAPDETEKPGPTEPIKELIYGDADNDGSVTASDALTILRVVVKLIPELEGNLFTQADVDANGRINAEDALYVLKHVVKLIEKFPAEQK